MATLLRANEYDPKAVASHAGLEALALALIFTGITQKNNPKCRRDSRIASTFRGNAHKSSS